ncbi:MAG TPA: transglutaminase domain-containing protein [Planctomycetota bacterium]|nr:transglutaminase domain-containing protein [Planctomycetota bacterium]
MSRAEAQDDRSPLPWAFSLAALIAMAAFGVFRREGMFAALAAILFFAPHALPLRASSSVAKFMLRVLAWGAALLVSATETDRVGGQTVYGDAVQVLTRIFIAELVVQNWMSEAARQRFSRRAVILLLSCMVFAAASKTFDVNRIFVYFAAPFFVVLSLAFRQLRERSSAAVQPKFAPRAWAHWVAVLAAITAAIMLSGTVQKNKRAIAQLTGIAGIVSPAPLAPPVVSYSDAPVLGPRQNVTRSLQRVMRVEGALPGPHLRGMSFDTYAGGRWEPPGDIRTFVVYKIPQGDPSRNHQICRITRLSEDIPQLFFPLRTQAFTASSANKPQREAATGDAFLCYDPPPFRYEAYFDENATEGLLNTAPTRRQQQRLLTVPNQNSTDVLWLAKELTGRLKEPLEKVGAVEDYLRKTHRYSLEANPGRGGDPVSDFILNKRDAHCEFFASAATILLRCAGVPTRYVTGFYVHERESNDTWMVRQQDAHAWAESYIPGKGWVTVEATPEAGMPLSMSEKLPFWRRWAERLGDWSAALWLQIKTWGALQWSVAGAIVLLAVIVGVVLRRRARRAKERPRTPDYVIPGKFLPEAARRIDERLATLSVPCPPHLTWQEHLEEMLSRATPPADRNALQSAADLAKRYAEIRFRTPDDEKHSEELLNALRK